MITTKELLQLQFKTFVSLFFTDGYIYPRKCWAWNRLVFLFSRLLWQTGCSSIMSLYHVGIYSDKELIGRCKSTQPHSCGFFFFWLNSNTGAKYWFVFKILTYLILESLITVTSSSPKSAKKTLIMLQCKFLQLSLI